MRYWIIIVFVGFLIPSLCFGWLTGYGYRKKATLTQDTDLTSYYHKKIICHKGTGSDGDAHVHLLNHCSAWPNDIRFYDNDDTTPLQHWLLTSTADSAVFWVEVADDISAGAVEIYVYYGKSGESSGSDIAAASLGNSGDDFSGSSVDKTKWRETQSIFSVGSGVLYVTNNSDDNAILANKGTESSRNYSIITRFRPDIVGQCRVALRLRLEDTTIAHSCYDWRMRCDFPAEEVRRFSGASVAETFQTDTDSWGDDTWVDLEFQSWTDGSTVRLRCYIDGVLELSGDDGGTNLDADGYAAIRHHNTTTGSTVEWDYFFVRKYLGEEAVINTWGSEETPGTPGWWDDNYLSRKQIYFGHDHETIDSLDTVELLFPTGGTQRIYRHGLSQSTHPWLTGLANQGDYLCATFMAPAKEGNEAKLRIFVNEYDNEAERWKQPYDVTGVLTEHDHHFTPSICIDTAGYLHLFYGCHLSDLKYRKSTNPLDVSAWGAEGEIHDDFQATYPRCYVDTSGDINVWFRGPISRQYGVSISSDGGSSWARDTIIWEDSTIEAQPAYGYVNAIAWYDSTIARTHLACTWRQNLPVEFEGHKHLAYAYLDDTSSKWKQRDGTEQTVPMKISNADIIYTSIGDTCNSVASICGNPDVTSKCIIQFWEWPGDDREQSDTVVYKVAYYDAGSWQIRTIATYAQPGNWNRSGIARTGSGANDTLHVFMKKKADDTESTELAWSYSLNDGNTWSTPKVIGKGDITGESNAFINVVDNADGIVRVMWAKPPWIFYLDNTLEWEPDSMLASGNDVRIVRMFPDSTFQQLDRVADIWNAELTKIYFRVQDSVIAGENAVDADNATYWVYYNYLALPADSLPPNDPDSCLSLWESAEDLTICTKLHGLGGWVCSPPSILFWVNELHAGCYPNPINITDPEMVNHGDRVIHIHDEDAGEAYRTISPNPSAHDVIFNLRLEKILTDCSILYVAVGTASNKYQIGISSDSAYIVRKKGGDWAATSVRRHRQRFMEIRFVVNSSGVSVWVDGTKTITNDNYLTTCDRIWIGASPKVLENVEGFVDRIIVRKWYENPPYCHTSLTPAAAQTIRKGLFF